MSDRMAFDEAMARHAQWKSDTRAMAIEAESKGEYDRAKYLAAAADVMEYVHEYAAGAMYRAESFAESMREAREALDEQQRQNDLLRREIAAVKREWDAARLSYLASRAEGG